MYDFSVYASTRKILAVTVLALMTAAVVPSFISAQSGLALQQRYEVMQGQLQDLKKVPEDIAIIKLEIASLQSGQKEQSDSIRNVILGLIGAAALKTLEVVFGVRRRKDSDG